MNKVLSAHIYNLVNAIRSNGELVDAPAVATILQTSHPTYSLADLTDVVLEEAVWGAC